MFTPSFDEVRTLAKDANLIPVYREITADLETPVSAYLKVTRGAYSFLLESAEGGERFGRYSFIGTEPYKVLRTGKPGSKAAAADPLLAVEAELLPFRVAKVAGVPRFHGGAVGYLAYETVRHFEPRVPLAETDVMGLPESIFMMADTLLVFDHLLHRIKVITHVKTEGDLQANYNAACDKIDGIIARLRRPVPSPARPHGERHVDHAQGEIRSNMPRDLYDRMLARGKEYIIEGDIIQVVLSHRFARPTSAEPFTLYRTLRTINPSPYMYYLHLKDFHIIGTSPEMLVRVEDGQIDYHPIAGSRPRGRTPEADDALAEELRHDEKEQAEHVMLLDLGRNDVGRVSVPGTVKPTQIMDVERYSHVMHLVSHVQGTLKPGLTSLDVLRAAFPAGTVSGAPKIRAMEIIAELEPEQRGPYAGAVGYVSFSGNLDTALTIRTIVYKDGVAYVQAGGGIVYDSVSETEFQETVNKASAALRSIEAAERFEAEEFEALPKTLTRAKRPAPAARR
ncbi:MAG: anthranilate synthase component I [Dehalococcoidia bacterium]|nr:anthranilate synthase component I [Dehalococcoidia bacterium]